MSRSSEDTTFNKTGSWRYLRPVSQEKPAPCVQACPAGTNIPRVLGLLAEGRLEDAYRAVKEDNPLPGVCGRVCYHPCELSCNRKDFDRAASIQALERFLADACEGKIDYPERAAARAEKVAIAGSGPAGLSCAYFLAREGFQVTIFEAEDEPGGMLRVGIPRYRLPREALDREIRDLTRLGVDFRLGCRVGKDVTISSLHRDFDAVFYAGGAHRSLPVGIPGEDLGQVLSGLGFLKQVNAGRPLKIGREVVVLGGGNTAIDAARVALRLGAKPLLVYRRSREEMPAVPEEVVEAQQEGVRFQFQAMPVRIARRNGKLAVQMIRTQLGEPDESGRRRPSPISGSEFTVECDTLLAAVGEQADFRIFGESGKENLLEAGVVLGGDAADGAGTVIDAIASGKRAAWEIMGRFLAPEDLPPGRDTKGRGAGFQDLNLDYFQHAARAVLPHQPVHSRIRDFDEVVGPLTFEQAMREAQRCFSCGLCTACDNCWVFCPEAAVSRVDGLYRINFEFCKGCGLCAQECPRGVISLVEEER